MLRLIAVAAALLTAVAPTATAAPAPQAAPRATAAAIASGPIAPGVKGFDVGTTPSASQLQCLYKSGYRFEVIHSTSTGVTLAQSLTDLANLGMVGLIYQGYPDDFGTPAQAAAQAKTLVSQATAAGYPTGGELFLDVEGNNVAGTSRAAQQQWIENWAKTIVASGYRAGVYIGEPQELLASDLNGRAMPDVSVFWKSASGAAPAAAQGFVARQSLSTSSCLGSTSPANSIDNDVAGSDMYHQGLLGTQGGSMVATANGTSTTVDQNGFYHAFAVGTNHQMYQEIHTTAGWLAPQSLGGSLVGVPAVIYQPGSNRYDVFAVNAAGVLQQLTFQGSWTGVHSISAGPFLPGVSGVLSADGSYHLFLLGTNHHLYQVAHTVSGWSGPQDLGGTFYGTPAVTYQIDGNRYDVFAITGNGTIDRLVCAGGRWTGPTAAGVPGTFAPGLAATRLPTGGYQVFATNAAHLVYDASGSANLTSRVTLGSGIAGDLGAVTANDTDRLDLFGVSTSDRLDQNYQPTGGAWQGFRVVGSGTYLP